MSNTKSGDKLKGVVRRPFIVQANKKKNRKAVNYKTGDSFETSNKKVFQSLIDNKKIKRA